MKKILIITTVFPPQQLPRAIQLYKIFNYLKNDKEFCFDIITSSINGNSEKIDENLTLISENLKIHPIKSLDFKKYFSKIFSILDFMYDGKIIWRKKAVKLALKLLKKNEYSSIVSFSQYFSSAIVGLQLKKYYPNTKLISFFSDPWTESIYYPIKTKWKHNLNIKYEREVFEFSDKLLFTNQQMIDIYSKKYGESIKNKSLITPHSFDNTLFEKAKKIHSITFEKNKINILHTGNFYEKRNPETFLIAYKKILQQNPDLQNNVKITFVGHLQNKIKKILVSKNLFDLVEWIPTVNYLESLAYISNADILLTIDAPTNKQSPFIPSKLIDYFGSNKKILAITPKDSSVYNLITENSLYNKSLFVANTSDVEQIKNNLLTLCTSNSNIQKNNEFEKYNINKIISKYINIF